MKTQHTCHNCGAPRTESGIGLSYDETELLSVKAEYLNALNLIHQEKTEHGQTRILFEKQRVINAELLEALKDLCDVQGRGIETEMKSYDRAKEAIKKAEL